MKDDLGPLALPPDAKQTGTIVGFGPPIPTMDLRDAIRVRYGLDPLNGPARTKPEKTHDGQFWFLTIVMWTSIIVLCASDQILVAFLVLCLWGSYASARRDWRRRERARAHAARKTVKSRKR